MAPLLPKVPSKPKHLNSLNSLHIYSTLSVRRIHADFPTFTDKLGVFLQGVSLLTSAQEAARRVEAKTVN